MTGVENSVINNICHANEIKADGKIKNRNVYGLKKEIQILRLLFFYRKFEYFIYESKMNTPEPDETFAEFKKRIYGKK